MNKELNSIKIPRLVSHLQTLLCSENMRRTNLTTSLKFAEKSYNFRIACHLAKFIQGASDKNNIQKHKNAKLIKTLKGHHKNSREDNILDTYTKLNWHFDCRYELFITETMLRLRLFYCWRSMCI